MCGISGIISSNPHRVDRSRLALMNQALAHRGPDGEGIFINPGGNAGLAHRRLAIIDLSPAAAQPMHYGGRYAIVHNGEIYNYKELRELLQQKGYVFQTVSDTEVIVAAYACYGDQCLQHFDGMFAFAIWDEQEQTLFAARDRFGEKPFYYYVDEEQLLFASEMKALWAAGVERQVNEKMLFNYITLGYTQNPDNPTETFFTPVQKLPARSFLKYSPALQQLQQEIYWDLSSKVQANDTGDEEAVETFHSLFQQSVQRRLRSDVPLGTSLSGGLDSSSVLATMTQLTGTPHKSFSAVFPGFAKDESRYIGDVVQYTGAQPFYVKPSIDSVLQHFEKVCDHQEEPFQSASLLAQYEVYRLAAQNGVKVLLDGQGADETLAGYYKYFHWYWQELLRADPGLLAGEIAATRAAGIDEQWGWKNKLAARFPSHAAAYLKRTRNRQQRNHPELHKDFVAQSGQSYYALPHIDTLNGVLYYNACMNGLEELLRYADRNAMAHGVEVRLPFLNHTLVAFAFSLPGRFKIRNGQTKWLLRKSMENHLPRTVVQRKDKVGFEPPQASWMQHDRFMEYIQEARRTLVKQGVLNTSVLDKKIRPLDAHAADNFDWRYLLAGRLWK